MSGQEPPSGSAPLPNSLNLAFIEEVFAEYLRNPAGVPEPWQQYFKTLHVEAAAAPTGDPFGPASRLAPSFRPRSLFNPGGRGDNGHAVASHAASTAIHQDRVDQLVRAYRVRGHIIAQIDPLRHPKPYRPELRPSYYGFRPEDLDRTFSARTIHGAATRSLREILLLLRDTYCRSIGVQFMHIDSLEARHWLQERMEGTRNRIKLSRNEQLRILTRLTDAVMFEEFIQKKYVGAKRFSLEGAESLIPLLDLALEHAARQGIVEVVMGMAHRGRLNVLANIVGKSPRQIFREFEDIDAELWVGRGDVKYHLGHHGEWVATNGQPIHVALCFNPSHLEFVNPVVMGRVRAKQDRLGDVDHEHSLSVLIHGDAAFAGEGVVQETLNLSELPGYRCGGTLHVVVNNQIGFTTTPFEGRSTRYATDVAKMLQSPIFHVNGENPEAVAQVVRLALDFRQTFRRDVVIDMYSYRRHGHNETDDPSFTHPLLYKRIAARKTVREGYLEHLLALGEIAQKEADEIAAKRRADLEKHLASVRDEGLTVPRRKSGLGEIWSRYQGGPDADVPEVETGVPQERLVELLTKLNTLPPDFTPHRTLKRSFLAARDAMIKGEKPLDWATAEALAFATLATEGARIRLSGQDSARGTFSQRHVIFYDYENGRPHCPLQHLDPQQAPFEVYNSPLSEAGVLGFEYGYSIAYPDALVLWEAQFGDFNNAAQVIIDQFLASAEDKWHSLTGLVLLLPHGLEGAGPEHSSARIERFLMLAAEDNLQVVQPSTPAQYFHVLRRQVVRPWRKPLIVATPKSLLRLPDCTSSLADLATGGFQRIIPDELAPHDGIARVLLCTGKVYYELRKQREGRGRKDVAIIRVEQLFPLAPEALKAALAPYAEGTPVYWVQEEPENQGAWPRLRLNFGERIGRWPLHLASRPTSASPATGSHAAHKLEQDRLMDRAFGAVAAVAVPLA